MKFPLLVLFATGALSAPFLGLGSFNYNYFVEDDCSDPRLSQDKTSIYKYEGETLNTVQGSTPQSTGLKLKADVVIHPLGACRYRMQIIKPELSIKGKNQVFQDLPGSEPCKSRRDGYPCKFARELKARDLVFQTAKGRINKLFPDAGEALHVLNIKRGILSTLQLQTDATEEVDVNGKCKVEFLRKDGVIVKKKDLTECSDRGVNEIGLQTANFAHSKMLLKPLASKSICHYVTAADKKIISVQCDESHTFRPFSAGYSQPAGAITTVKQVMVLDALKRSPQYSIEGKLTTSPVTLIYGHEKEATKPDNNILSRIETVMSQLMKSGSLSAKQSSANEFVQLVHLIRKLDSKRMGPIMDKYFNYASGDENTKNVYKQFLLDALTYCGTPTCVTTVRSLIKRGDVTGEYRNMFLQGISLVAKPTKQMVADVLSITQDKPSRQAFLALGTLIQRYCKINPANCAYSKSNPVTKAEIFLETKLGRNCDEQGDDERAEEILMALKAIANARQPLRVKEVLLGCVSESKHMNITTAALDALKRLPCDKDIQSHLHKILENVNIDVEKRIQTYATLMNCPQVPTLRRVVEHLENEKSSQVGSFMLSHLKNILESSDPIHNETQILLKKMMSEKDFSRFDLPLTKFSKAFEGSVYSKYLKSGATVNGHLIYNHDSFLPKSSLISMSAKILDVPVEVFEMAGRIDGVESIVEDFFGPYGYFPEDTVLNFFQSKFNKEDLEKLRTRRSVEGSYKDTVDGMHKMVNKKKKPNGFLSMKVLGHEMRVFSLDDLQWAADEIDNMNVIELLLKVAKGGSKTFTKSIMFMEMTHTAPTGLGLPIKLMLTGSAVGSLELDGKFDIRNMFWGPMALEIKGSVKPSSVVEVSGQMGVHSIYADTGLFVNSSMFTSQVLKGSILYREGQQLKINIDAPEKPIEFFNVSSTPFLFANEDFLLVEGTQRRLSPDFCMNSKMVLGLGLCTRVSVPVAFRDYEAPYFPLSGPASFGLKLVKADPKLTTYQFLVSLDKRRLSSGSELIGTFEVGTPGATYSRGFAGSIKYKETTNVREITLGAGKGNTELKITYQNNTNRFEVSFGTDAITPKPVNIRFLFFNETSYLSKETGILASATYDWYKFQHVTKFVRKLSRRKSFLLHSRTTYWPGKYVTGEAEYSPDQKKVSLRFDANQFNQRVEMDGKIMATETGKGIAFTATHISSNKQISFYTGYTNTDDAKKIVFNVKTKTSKPVEFILGYYLTGKRHEIRFDASVLGKSGKLFIDYSNLRTGWHGVNLGGIFEENSIGLATSYNFEEAAEQHGCVVAYFNEKRPAKVCLALSNKKLTWSVEILKKTASLSLGLRTEDDRYTLDSIITVQERELMRNIIELAYKSMMENELKMTTYTGKRSLMARFFSTKENDYVNLFGVEGKGFGQHIKLQATYSKAKRGDATVYGVIFEGWINKKLPVSYTVFLENGEKLNGVKTLLKIMHYTAKAGLFFGTPKQSDYVVITDMSLEKNGVVMLGSKTTNVLVWMQTSKAYKSVLEATVMNKKFKYGFDLGYEKRSRGMRSEHVMTLGVDFARDRRSSVTATLVSSEKLAELLIDFNYLPGKLVQHVLRYDMSTKRLDISIEFLPKMYIKLGGQLNRLDGWQLNTDVTLSWSNFEKTLQSVTAYINKANTKGLNFQLSGFDQKFFIGSEYSLDTKTLILTASAFGRSARLTFSFDKAVGLGRIRLSMQQVKGNRLVMKDIVETLLRFSMNKLSYELNAGQTTVLKVSGILEETRGSLELSVMGKSISKLSGFYFSEDKRAMGNLVVLGTELLQVVGRYNKARSNALLSFTLLRERNIVFVSKWNKDLKEVTLAAEYMKKTIGITARFDPSNYAAGVSFFYQKNVIGWDVAYLRDTSSLVYRVTLSPKLSARVVLQLTDDRIISLNFQRQTEYGYESELALKYKLSSDKSSFILKWNQGTVRRVKEMILPALTNAAREISTLTEKATSLGQSLSMKTINKLGRKILEIIDTADKKFDEIDFIAVRDNMGALAVKGMSNIGEIVEKGIKLSSKGLMMIHDKVPMMTQKAEQYFSKAIAISKLSLKEAIKLAKVTYVAAKSVTEAGIPVAKLAFKLAKEFKIRGKTTEEIVMNLVKMAEKIAKSYKENVSQQIKKTTEDVRRYVVALKLPFTDKKIVQIVKEYAAKLKSINWEEKAREATMMVLEYEVMGEKVKNHIQSLAKLLKNLPKETKKLAVNFIRRQRLLIKRLRSSLAAFEPLIRCLKKIYTSTSKHFGPLVVDVAKNVKLFVKTQYTPLKEIAEKVNEMVREFLTPLLRPLKPLYKDLKMQVRAIRLLEKELGTSFDDYVAKLTVKAAEIYNQLYSIAERNIQRLKKMPERTLEEMAVKTIDQAENSVGLAIVYTIRAYGDIQKILSTVRQAAIAKWKMVKVLVDTYTSLPIEYVFSQMARAVGQKTMLILRETSELLDQIAELDFKTPIKRAWREMDVINHLGKYGLNRRLTNFIAALKKVDTKQVVLENIDFGKQALSNSYDTLIKLSRRSVDLARHSADYIKSIPKKDFENWYSEVESSVMKAGKRLTTLLEDSYAKMTQLYQKTEAIMKEIYRDYKVPVQNAYLDVKQRAVMVYDDVKDDCAIVCEVYKTIVYGAANEQYQKMKNAIEKQYKDMKEKVVAFYRRYEDKTWEEIGSMLYSVGKERYDVAYKVLIQRYEEASKVGKKALRKASDLQVRIVEFVKLNYAKMEKLFNDKIKPEGIKMYKEVMLYVKKQAQELRSRVSTVYQNAIAEVLSIYGENKYLSIRQLSVKAQRAIVKLAKEYITKVKKVVKENYGKVYSKMMQLRTMFMKDVLPVMVEELESIINQSLRASVLLAEETVKAFRPHYMTVKKYTNEYVKKAAALAKKYYTEAVVLGKRYAENSKEMTLEMYKKATVYTKEQYTKLVEYMDNLVEKVKSNPRYQELIKSDAFIRVEKFVKWLKEMAVKRIEELKMKMEELKNHPRIQEMKKRFQELREHEMIRKTIQNVKQMRKSALYSLEKIKEKLQPELEYYKSRMEGIPALTMAMVERFREDPVTCFWDNVEVVGNLMKTIMEYNWKELKTTVPTIVTQFLKDITDYETKEAYYLAVSKGKKFYMDSYDYIVALPAKLKTEVLKVYRERREMLNRFYAQVVEQWRASALYPVITNPIWSEISQEFMNHEITIELKDLMGKSLENIKELYAKLSADMKGYMKEVRAKLIDRYTSMLTLLDETSLEDIVLKMKEIYDKTTAKVVSKVQELSVKANERVQEYKEKIIALANKQYGIAKSYFDKQYPVVIAQMKKAYMKYMKLAEEIYKKIVAKGTQLRSNAMSFANEVVKKSAIKARFNRLMKMTVGETFDRTMKFPQDTRRIYNDLAQLATAKYNIFVQPYVKSAVSGLRFVGNEINESVIFFVKYYRFVENAKVYYRKGLMKIQEVLPKVPVAAKEYLKLASKASLKGVHSSLVYVDKIDLNKLRMAYEKLRKSVPDLKKYASVNLIDGGVELRIAHPYEVKPSMSYHVMKVKNNVEQYAEKITAKTVAMTKALLKEMRMRTLELRKDLNQSYLAHVKLSKHAQSLLPAFRRVAKEQHAVAKKKISEVYDLVSFFSAYYVKEGKKKASDIYKFGTNAAGSILQAQSVPEAYELAKAHAKDAVKKVQAELKPLVRLGKTIIRDARRLYKKVLTKVEPYYKLAKKSGLRAAYDEIEKELMQVLQTTKDKIISMKNDALKELRSKVTSEDIEIIGQYTNLHTGILSKYAKRLYKLYAWNKRVLDRTIRRSKMSFLYRLLSPLKRRIDPLRTYAMIFGKRHVMTFDGKYYEFPKYAKSSCTYLLARDFKDGKFTIYSQEEKIIAETPDITVSIDRNGAVEGAIKTTKAGVTRSEKVSGVPIETPNAECKRWSHYIKCQFKPGVTIRCNVKYYLCTIELSGWNYGKSQGVLGTNNREGYDEFKMPENKLTSSVEQFANSWLVTKTSSCMVKDWNNYAPTCNAAPSERCVELFKSSSSPLAKHFSQLDPLPFMRTCQIDTADCEESFSHCYSVAAYRTMLQMSGVRANKVKDCYSSKSEKRWTVKQKKDVDVVVVMSSRKEARNTKKTVASLLYNMNKQITNMGYDARYALVSYGSSTKGRYGARSHTFKGKYFSTENEIATKIKSMKYTGEENDVNDYNQAILSATYMPFKPEAMRVIILVNFDKYIPSWYGPSADETKFALKYEANASLFVFDKFNFDEFQLGYKRAIGMTSKKLYMTPSLSVYPMTKPLPRTPFTKYIQNNGGIFSNQITKKSEKIFTKALSRAVLDELKEGVHLCKSCFNYKHRIVCRTNKTARCF